MTEIGPNVRMGTKKRTEKYQVFDKTWSYSGTRATELLVGHPGLKEDLMYASVWVSSPNKPIGSE